MHHALSREEVFKKLSSSEKGLTSQQAKERLKKYGKNVIKETNKLQPIKILIEQVKSFLIYVLFIAAVISFMLGHMIDAFVILAIVLINTAIGFFQQYKAEKAIIGLRKLLVQTSMVVRDGKHTEIPSAQIVPGDILIFDAGDKVNADCRILASDDLKSNEAILTGESLPIIKKPQKLAANTILAERINMLYTGTQVVAGSAKALVVSTGMNTEFGKIASKLQEIEIQKTPMQKRLDVFSKQISFIILGLVAVIFLLGVLKKTDILETFMVAVTLAVGAIPEGLPAVLAIAFAIASKAMSKKNVIIRKLPAVESLGSVSVICTDKTGTLTEEKMHVQEIFTNNQVHLKKAKEIFLKNKKINTKDAKELNLLLKTSILCSNARFELIDGKYKLSGDPTEEALLSASLDLGLNKKTLTTEEPSIKRYEFTSKRKMMSILRYSNKNRIMYSKGAAEKILSLSTHEMINNKIEKLTEKRRKHISSEIKKMESKALRVLGFAYKDFGVKENIEEKGLVFLGFAGMIDPPRKEVKQAIKDCKNAGIKVKVITGDAALTAKAIAKQIGIEGKTITGKELEKINDAVLMRSMKDIVIFARTTPHQKLRIAKILQQQGEVVAMTGDGINDVLALKAADIGISMGIRGTDVARDVSDVVLVDDNFASIVGGVRQGRKTYDNIKKFTKYMLSVNFDTILLVTLLTLMSFPLPILPLQILWKNIITDSFPALTLVLEKEEQVMKSKPRKEKSILSGISKFIILGGILNFLACAAVYFIGTGNNLPIDHIRTMVVTTGIVFELLFVYTCRSKKPLSLFKKKKDKSKEGTTLFSNKWLNYAILLGVVLHLILLYTPLATIFHVVPLALNDWLLILPFGISGLLIFEVVKYFRRKKLIKLEA